ncbi:hypothetical protein MNBD_GAMMA12-592 [hydrothermal vent metagenome]|uniref:Uncharacterized protein n=1 Tax=hydrothermal vent metagenome TaxID=652676 RepID=A0A3B0YM77_9ZZZZ
MKKVWRFIALISLVLIISSCGSSFKSGQKVWVHLPGKSIAHEGYAVAKLIKINNGKAHLQVLKLVKGSGSRLQRKMQARRVIVSSDLLIPYKEGKTAWTDRRQAARKLASLLSNSKRNSKRNSKQSAAKEIFVDRVVDNNELPEFTAGLSLYRLRKNYLSGKPVVDRLANIPYVLRKLKSLAQQHKAYQTILKHMSSTVVYSTRDGQKSVAVVIRPVKQKRQSNRMHANLFTQRAASTVHEIRQIINSSVNGRLAALKVVQNMPILLNAETAYLNFVTDNGTRYKKTSVSNILVIRKRQIGQKILPQLRKELMASADLNKAKSEQDAVSRYERVASKAKRISQLFGITVMPGSAKQQWFVLPVRKRLARLKRDEKHRFQLAMNRDLPIAEQASAIKRYLSDYPQGEGLGKIKNEQVLLLKRQIVAAKIHERRLKKLITLLTSRHQYEGLAGYQKKKLRFSIKIRKFNKNSNHFSGTITWPEKQGAINKITGKLNRSDLSIQFKEVTIIKRGSWRPGSKYSLTMDNDKHMKGIHFYRFFVFPKRRSVTITMK